MTTTAQVVATDRGPMPAGWQAGTWVIDPAHTTVGFVVRHLMSRVRGSFDEVSGQIITGPDPAGSTASAVVAVASISTGNETRDSHLRSADFFDAEQYPSMTFTSTTLRPGNGAWVLSGDLTIRDVTQPIELEVQFLGADPTGLQGEPRIGFCAQGTINRCHFGISFGLAADAVKIIVADQVSIILDVQAFGKD